MAEDSLLNPVGKLCVFPSGRAWRQGCPFPIPLSIETILPQSYDKLLLPTNISDDKKITWYDLREKLPY